MVVVLTVSEAVFGPDQKGSVGNVAVVCQLSLKLSELRLNFVDLADSFPRR